LAVLAKGCAICLVLLVVSPVTAPFRTLDALAACAGSHAGLSGAVASDPVFIEETTLKDDAVVAQSMRFGGVIPLASASRAFAALLSAAGSPPLRVFGEPAGGPSVSPVLRL
jgi:hypothetical protein